MLLLLFTHALTSADGLKECWKHSQMPEAAKVWVTTYVAAESDVVAMAVCPPSY